MIIRKEYEFPVLEKDGIKAVEQTWLELKRKRRDEELSEAELDWFDYANNILLTA
jgi:hypothetical protein